MRAALLAFALCLPAAAPAQMYTSHRSHLGRFQEGQSTKVTASFVDSSPTPQPAEPDVVNCWVWQKGVDPAKVAPLYTCETIEDPGTAAVEIFLPPLATRISSPNSTATERHYIKVLGQADGYYIPLEGEFDVISDPGLVVDPDTGIPGPVLPPTPTPND